MSTTTTTTTLPPIPSRPLSLKFVETIRVTPSLELLGTDSSDSKGTLKTIKSTALSFGSLAPGETSETMIIYLKVPNSIAINNIKLALIGDGNLVFSDTTFGVEIHPFLDYNVIPSTFFEGINSSNDPDSGYNITVGNRDNNSSQYVYLNVVIPSDQAYATGTIRFRWFFNYA